MLSGDFLMDLARRIQTGLELAEKELLPQTAAAAQTGQTEGELTGADLIAQEQANVIRDVRDGGEKASLGDIEAVESLTERSRNFAAIVAKIFREKNIGTSEIESIASRIGCRPEDVNALRRPGASRPSKDLVAVLCLALNLTPQEAAALFQSAGYTLLEYEVSDIVLTYCLEKGVCTISDLNTALECFNIKAISRSAVVQELDRRVWAQPRLRK